MAAIIKSLLDTDLYKLTMMQAVFHQHPNVMVKYEFKCRNAGINFKPLLPFIDAALNDIKKLTFDTDEISYLMALDDYSLFKMDFIHYLMGYRNDHNTVKTYLDNGGDLHIEVTGTWLNTILWEVPVLAVVNEIYFTTGKTKEEIDALITVGEKKLADKIEAIKRDSVLGHRSLKIAEFGTRRRFSGEWQSKVVGTLVQDVPNVIIGTSNVALARKFNIRPIGTHAHEWFMAHQALVRVEDSQKVALQNWASEYRGKLAIALSDTLGIDAFLRDFDLYFAKLYDGVRQDSGDPLEVYRKVVNHYKRLGIDPKTKTIIFSDGLDVNKAIDINKNTPEINAMFGIGTSLTNDLVDEPLQIVMKLTECNNKAVAKISEARGKTMCNDPVYLTYLKSVFQID